MNQTILTQVRVAMDLELKYPQNSDQGYVQFLVVDTMFIKGEKKTQLIPLTVFGTKAEKFATYMQKGSLVNIFAKLKMSSYEKDGKKLTSMGLVCSHIEYLSPVKKSDTQITTTEENITNKSESNTTETNNEDSFEDVSDIDCDTSIFGDDPF